MAKLHPAFIQRAISGQIEPGRYYDNGGLILNVSKGGASWILRYRLDGERRDMGLGPAKYIPLGKARELAAKHQLEVRINRQDPLEQRQEARREKERGEPFADFAERFIADRIMPISRKRGVLWLGSLKTYAFPVIGRTGLDQVTRAQVIKILEPIWDTKPETARRVRQRIERVLDAAHAKDLRENGNPARALDLRAVLAHRRPPIKHHAALPWRDLPAFYKALRQQPGGGARALQFAILTCGRTSEVLGATWPEIDTKASTWTLSAGRMKARNPHRVPLSKAALALLKAQPSDGEHIFAGAREGKPLSGMAMLMTLRRMKRGDITAHGFRSSFRDWCADSGKPRELAEAALAHIVGGVEGAYFRSDLFEQRRELMGEWARFVCGR